MAFRRTVNFKSPPRWEYVNSFLIDIPLRVRANIENLILSERLFFSGFLARKVGEAPT